MREKKGGATQKEENLTQKYRRYKLPSLLSHRVVLSLHIFGAERQH